jgi:nucleoside-diphosphate-sugar epimerase
MNRITLIGISSFVGTHLIELLKQQENSIFSIAVSLSLQKQH